MNMMPPIKPVAGAAADPTPSATVSIDAWLDLSLIHNSEPTRH